MSIIFATTACMSSPLSYFFSPTRSRGALWLFRMSFSPSRDSTSCNIVVKIRRSFSSRNVDRSALGGSALYLKLKIERTTADAYVSDLDPDYVFAITLNAETTIRSLVEDFFGIGTHRLLYPAYQDNRRSEVWFFQLASDSLMLSFIFFSPL